MQSPFSTSLPSCKSGGSFIMMPVVDIPVPRERERTKLPSIHSIPESSPVLTISVRNSSARQIVRTQFNRHLVAHQNFHVIFSNLARNGGQDGFRRIGGAVNDASKHGIRKGLQHNGLDFNDIVLDLADAFRLVLSIVALCAGRLFAKQRR